MNLSLVMATVHRADVVRRLIDSLVAQSDRSFELIVVDQNADRRLDPIIATARGMGVEVVHDRFVERNLSAARNRGLELARGSVSGFPDDDCWYGPRVVQGVSAFLHAHGEYDGVVARWHEQDPTGRAEHDLSLDDWRRFRAAPASSISLFLRQAALAALGGFDARFGVSRYFGAGEETDLLLRALAAGRRIRYVPTIVVHHAFAGSPSGPLAQACQRTRSRERGVGALYAKHKLPASVVVRGIVAPLVKPLLPPRSMRGIVNGLCTALGRIEGLVKWKSADRQ